MIERQGLRERVRRLAALVFSALLVLGCARLEAQSPGAGPVVREVPASREAVRLSFAPVVAKASPAVVSITSRRSRVQRQAGFDDPFFDFFFRRFGGQARPQRRVETSLGSGVIVGADGVVVTNHHVVEGAEEIEVVLADRRAFAAELISSDQASDLAFLRLEGARDLPALPLGNSDSIEVGDLVLAIGNPFGIGQTVTSGIVSAKARSSPMLQSDVTFIQTDAAINPGNSGGALITLDGRLIGVNTAIFTRGGGSIGIGFAIPGNLVRARLAAVQAGQVEMRRPWLGAATAEVLPDVAHALGLERPRGVVVEEVYPGSAADEAGLAPGDVVLAVDGIAIDDPSSLAYRLSLRPLGERAGLAIWRRGREVALAVAVEPPPDTPAAAPTLLRGRHPLDGVTVANRSPALNEKLEADLFERGVVVLELARGAAARRLGVRPGDGIATVNGRRINDTRELEQALKARPGRWEIGVRRNGQVSLLRIR
ncbi:Do family serine endopeptidase [Geminicoccaceae bacterium 1502E]|nr:Do family serine endopeptidase [Geminicoccaceae bacterium 1502E]